MLKKESQMIYRAAIMIPQAAAMVAKIPIGWIAAWPPVKGPMLEVPLEPATDDEATTETVPEADAVTETAGAVVAGAEAE